ncbi:MAG TPA: 1,2-phenylacetyl-CoA epoxidase subunit PaaD [Bacteroidota bacterium]|nr:1,2-phenylacetyl-CoA epoxidase subunit PaaD [Bacteroidota bacterium]
MHHPSKDELLNILSGVHDPEIPALDVVEMGIVRNAECSGGAVQVDITPTYSGCPAMRAIEDDIIAALKNEGFEDVLVNTVYSPAWTTEWLTDSAKLKLKINGIAPPGRSAHGVIVILPTIRQSLACPFCESHDTEVRSEFGSTACKSLHYCNNCKQPFEHFKEI